MLQFTTQDPARWLFRWPLCYLPARWLLSDQGMMALNTAQLVTGLRGAIEGVRLRARKGQL